MQPDIKIRSSYNISGVSFSPRQIAEEIQKNIPEFKITFSPDYRQNIADSWPDSINDDYAQKDWKWAPKYNLPNMALDMLKNLEQILLDRNKV